MSSVLMLYGRGGWGLLGSGFRGSEIVGLGLLGKGKGFTGGFPILSLQDPWRRHAGVSENRGP